MIALYILGGLSLVSLLAEIIQVRKGLTILIIVGILAAMGTLVLRLTVVPAYFHGMLVFDSAAIAMSLLLLMTTVGWLAMQHGYFIKKDHQTDRTALVLFVVIGGIIMVSFNNLSMLFLGIEILSISLYTLCGSDKDNLFSNEAAFKYFLLGSFATGFLLMGVALIYGATGSFDVHVIADVVMTHTSELPGFFYAGVLLLLVGLLFKISAAPFHFWAPDVYDGAPVPITALMSTVVKIAALGAFYRMMLVGLGGAAVTWTPVVVVVAVITLIIPNITAVWQSKVKRMLAYSSVGHVGYLLLAFIANTPSASNTMLIYLAAYAVASLAAFSVLQKVDDPDGFSGLLKNSPLLAVTMMVALFSLAGIPPLAGFMGKYMVLREALMAGYTSLVILAVVTSLIGVYYYFRVILLMVIREPLAARRYEFSPLYKVLLIVLVVLMVLLGVFPNLINALTR